MQGIFMSAPILLPKDGTNYERWATLACDQFTSEPEYWAQAESFVGDEPSALKIVLPEVYLEKSNKSVRIGKIHETMKSTLRDVLTKEVHGFVYVRRTTASGTREGIVGMIDLELYSYEKGAKPVIRPTEKTVVERIPPRVAVRRGAVLEAPHILMLIDDDEKAVIEPLYEKRGELDKLYDFDLMLGGGHVEGYAVTSEYEIKRITDELARISSQSYFDNKYPRATGECPLAMAVGDGNHSLATAKAYWEELKKTLSAKELSTHPARYCLVELENIHSEAIVIEPIHRVVFGVQPKAFIAAAEKYFEKNGARLTDKKERSEQKYTIITKKSSKEYSLINPAKPLAVGSLDAFLAEFLEQNLTAKVDYVHDEASVRALCKKDAIGILLPPFDKADIFKGVILGGVLPKKTFSMGTAREKRYYLECRRIKG